MHLPKQGLSRCLAGTCSPSGCRIRPCWPELAAGCTRHSPAAVRRGPEQGACCRKQLLDALTGWRAVVHPRKPKHPNRMVGLAAASSTIRLTCLRLQAAPGEVLVAYCNSQCLEYWYCSQYGYSTLASQRHSFIELMKLYEPMTSTAMLQLCDFCLQDVCGAGPSVRVVAVPMG